MAGSRYIEAVGPSYHLTDKKAATETAVNTFPSRLKGQNWILESAPGTVLKTSLGRECRGSRYVSGIDRWFVVSGFTLYEMSLDGLTATALGALSTSSGPVSLANNTTQLAIVDGDNLYIFTFSLNTFTRITSPGWRGSDSVSELDGYFIFADPGTDQYYISAIDDGTNLDALDFTSADAQPDFIVGHTVSHHQLFVMGGESTEIWIDSGGQDFPFTRYNSYPIEVGMVGPHAFVNAASTFYFVGKTKNGTGVVYSVEGNRPVPISNHAVEQALLSSTDISAVTMWAYQPENHEFVAINAPGLKTTWVYDARHKQWHERGLWVDDDWQPLPWAFVTAIGTRHFCGDMDGDISLLDEKIDQIKGEHLVRERTWPHMINPSMESVSYLGVEVSCETGYGGSITLEISNDGGTTFGPKLARYLGATGRRMERIRWNRLGSSRNRVFRLRCSDPVPWTIYAGNVDIAE